MRKKLKAPPAICPTCKGIEPVWASIIDMAEENICRCKQSHRHVFPLDSDICSCGFERVWEGTIYDHSR